MVKAALLGIALILSSVLVWPINAADEVKSQASYLQDISVTIRAGRSEGSGVLSKVGDDGFCLTAGHVVDGLRKVEEVIDPKSGARKLAVKFDDAEIVKDLYEDGRKVGEMRFLAEVVRFSTAEKGGQDIAILKARKKGLALHTVKFYLDDKIPEIGTELHHVGSLLGQGGSNSMTSGIYSQIGRLYENQVYDQTSCAAFPGSSGGGVFLKSDGRYVGMVVRGAGETFNLTVPVRRIREWTKKVGMEWVVNPTVQPTEEWKKFPAEDIGVVFSEAARDSAKPKEFSFLIRKIEPALLWFLPK